MVWPFKKKKVLDLTSSSIKVPESVRARLEKEYKDVMPATGTNADSGSGLSFLSALAGSSELKENEGDNSLKDLKVKIEDLDYKFDSLSRQLSKLIDRIDLTEKKIDKWERRGLS